MKPMTLKDAEAFVKKLHGHRISVHLGRMGFFDAMALVGADKILVSKGWWEYHRFLPASVKRLLAHEVGHFNIDYDGKSFSSWELKTHLWAIRKTKSLGMTAVNTLLKADFRRWRYEEWNSSGRIYVLARREFARKRMRYR